MFEVDYYKYTMYDANDPKDAPYGYIARTNFSFAGEVNRGAGYVRYMEADRVLMRASAMGELRHRVSSMIFHVRFAMACSILI